MLTIIQTPALLQVFCKKVLIVKLYSKKRWCQQEKIEELMPIELISKGNVNDMKCLSLTDIIIIRTQLYYYIL